MPIMSDIEVELPPNSIDARIRDYRLELDRLMLEYTENHPDVIAAREAGDRLEAQRADRLRALGIEDADQQLSTLRSNPVYQALQIAINEADVEIAEREADIVEHESALQELQALIDEVPRVEAELARLNRDYEVVYEQYQALVRSRETQDLSRKVSDMDQTQFRVINPPLADLEPVAPQRFTLLVMVFAASLVVGNGLCWLLSQLWPVFSDTQTLRKTCGLPVLGVVTNARQELDRSRKRTATASFAAATLVLIAVFLLCAYMALAGPGLAIMRRSVG
jgi:polysaccharide chain length determinant protein (PEP-CTERM system associated)